jgi:hypothetical protein
MLIRRSAPWPKSIGAITFILEHPIEIETYLADQDRAFEEIKTRYPMPPEMEERFKRAWQELSARPS